MIQTVQKNLCCGCGACAQKCPRQAISMQPDSEGFYYPQVNPSRCINCGLCEKVCPIKSGPAEKEHIQFGYVAQNKNPVILKKSSSGGIFSVIAAHTIRQNGVVFGAIMTDEHRVIHTYTDTLSGLEGMRGSKYVQSHIGNCYLLVQQYLKSGRMVCFSGTPCQVEGLLTFLGVPYPSLITVDIVCHAVASPKIWKMYTDLRKAEATSAITSFIFRDKAKFGYQLSTMSACCGSIMAYYGGIATDPYLRAFFSDICDRPSCYNCHFKKRFRNSDFTIWDCFDSSRFVDKPRTMNTKLGVSCVLAQNEKAERLLRELSAELNVYEVSPTALLKSSHEMTASVSQNAKRNVFFKDAETLTGKALFSKYFPIALKNKAEDAVRRFACKTGLYSAIRKTAKAFIPTFKRY